MSERGKSANFTSLLRMRDDPGMRIAVTTVLALAVTGCAANATRTLPRSSLLVRARAGEEPPPSAQEQAVVRFAAAEVGKRYCRGGTGPACFDCSGLVQRAWSAVGVHVPRTSAAIASELTPVPLDDVRAGDILWWPGHVAIYAGEGWAIEALDARDGVVRRPARDPYRAFRP
jgi:cell wall-associated NlpC family hydrolase